MTETCATCKFWVSRDGGQSGECHRWPRVFLAQSTSVPTWVYPLTIASDFCGEWKQDAKINSRVPD